MERGSDVMHRSDHFAFRVSNMDRAIAFYTEKLGLRLMFRERDEQHEEEYAFLELEGGNLELIQPCDGGEPFVKPEIHSPYCPHLALSTDSMESTLAMLAEREIPIV